MSPRLPLVSVVIPTRHRAHMVEGAVRSVLDQTHPRIEVWVVDDASNDATPEVLAALAAEHERVHRVRLDEAAGAAGARNVGIARSQGEVVAFLDDDSRWVPDKIERQLPALDEAHGAVVCPKRVREPGGGSYVEGSPDPDGPPMEALLGFPTSTFLVWRELLVKVGGFDETLPRLHDWDLLLRLSRVTRVAILPNALVEGVIVEGGITLTRGPLVEAARTIVTRHSPALGPGDFARLRYILGKFLLVDGHTTEARRFMASAVGNAPWVPRYWAGLVATLLGPHPARWIRDRRRVASRQRLSRTDRPDGPEDSHNPRDT